MTGEFAIAVHALVFLSYKKSTLCSETIAKNVCTNPARIRKVMAKLKKGGLITTKEGADGGYLFEKDPHEVTLKEVCEATDTCPVSSAWRSGDMNCECLIASGIADVMDGIYEDLNEACKEKLKSISISDIEQMIFKRN
ncbi:Rrf2 family transcriptional regulator [Oscillospiraceae bacterium PP1C4]